MVSKILKILALVLTLLAGGWFLWESKLPSSPPQPSINFSSSDQGEGAVTMTVEYLSQKSDEKNLALKVSLNTHSADLTTVNFTQDIYLEKDGKRYNPVASLDEGETHHRASELLFPRVDFPFKVIGQNIGGVAKREILMEAKAP